MKLQEWISGRVFRFVHGRSLVYNTCWEDPRLDRVALRLGPQDSVLVITSAGCNALDYALQEPRRVIAVDMNPRQNALLDLKIAGIRRLDFETFFAMFGKGRLANAEDVYQDALRDELPATSRRYWDKAIRAFRGSRLRPTFYFHGASGAFARMINFYIDRVARIRPSIEAIFAARSVSEQREIYEAELRDKFWNRFVRWAMRRDSTLTLLGVPRAQRIQVERGYMGGISKFVEDCVEAVFANLPLADNYFWRLYTHGEYQRDCCPEYLVQANFQRLKDGLVDRVETHTTTILDYLDRSETPISRFVLLDHMDWMSSHQNPQLRREWQAIVDHAARDARLLWRSGALDVDFVDPIPVRVQGKTRRVGDLLHYDRELANQLHAADRVHTYGSFYVADLQTR